MKIKTALEFISFSDGVCDVYAVDEEGVRTSKFVALGFANRALGYGRVFAAAAVQVEVNAVVCVPMVTGISIHDTLEAYGSGTYEIVLAQHKPDTNPPSIDLTLRQLEMHV